ncbi:HD domain protein [uncultured archaeon]|nr:HD domain protein [uncultured archaeon]
MSNLERIFEAAGKLKKTKRTGWTYIKIKNPESVADHSYRTSLMAFLLAKKLGLDENKMIKLALLHDLVEAETGDLVVEGKGPLFNTTKEEKQKLEKKAAQKIFKNSEYLELWEEYEDKKSEEARAVWEIDKLEVVVQALEYEKEGYPNTDFEDFWATARSQIKNSELRKIFLKLEEERLK